MWTEVQTRGRFGWKIDINALTETYYADLATGRERQLTTGKRAKRTKRDFRCSICRSAIGQVSCLICARRRQLTFPFCSIAKSAYFLKPLSGVVSIRIQVKSYAVSQISLDSCKLGLKQFKVVFAGSSLECPCKPHSQFLPPHSTVHGVHFCTPAKQVLLSVDLIMK